MDIIKDKDIYNSKNIKEKRDSLFINYPFTPKVQGDPESCFGFCISEWYETVYNNQYKKELFHYIEENFGIEEEYITEDYLKFSVGFPYGNRDYNDFLGKGAIVRQQLDHCINEGIVLEKDFNFNLEMPEIMNLVKERKDELLIKAKPFKLKEKIQLKNIEEIVNFMDTYEYPVIAVMNIYSNFFDVGKDGIIPMCNGTLISRHTILINGFNNDLVRFLNDWGKEWGLEGYGYFFKYDESIISEAWGLIPQDHTIFSEDLVENWRVRIFSSIYKQRTIDELYKLTKKQLTQEQMDLLGINYDYLSGEIIEEDGKFLLQVGSFDNKFNAYKLIDVLREIGYKNIILNIKEPK